MVTRSGAGVRVRTVMGCWLALGMTVLLLLFGGSPAAAAPAPEKSAGPFADLEDPRALEREGVAALAAGDRDRARAAFDGMLTRLEVSRYLDYRPSMREALLLERLGDLEGAARLHRTAIQEDVHRAIQVLRIVSEHPDREALVQEAYDHVRALVRAVEAGEEAVIYLTTKGAKRPLTPMTVEELLKLAAEGKRAQYCYIADLDLTHRQDLPEKLELDRCVVGRLRAPDLALGKLVFRAIVLGDADLGKTWEGEPNKSKTIPPSTFQDLMMRDAIFAGRANFAGVAVEGEGRAYFPLAVFEGEADFKGAEFWGVTEFRFASFGAGANFKHLRMHAPVYFGASRYRADTIFTGVYSDRDVYFNSAVFEGKVTFDHCEWQRTATFEDAQFHGPANFGTTRVESTFNLSRAVFQQEVNVKEVEVGELTAFGVEFRAPAYFTDAIVRGRTRFSLDEVTRHSLKQNLDALLPLYRRYQGDEDADEPLTTRSSYGVEQLEDLTAKIHNSISFANTVFGGYTVFEGVTFGSPGAQGQVASFFNSQFLGETHFERTHWNAQADFTTIFGTEVAFNAAAFEHSLILDDAAVTGRVTLTDATFLPAADLSFYGAEVASFQIEPGQVDEPRGHRLFFERCARTGEIPRGDVRIGRLLDGQELDDAAIRELCFDSALDELTALKDSYGNRAMTVAEDDAYWWSRHLAARQRMIYASWPEKLRTAIVDILIFELCFGWGVRLGNLGLTVVVVTFLYAVVYKVFCKDTVMQFNGTDMKIGDIPFFGMWYVSLGALIAVNNGWDFGEDDNRFRVLNASETLIGFIILTFFVGAYTRMILA